jgi:hypothetical protein
VGGGEKCEEKERKIKNEKYVGLEGKWKEEFQKWRRKREAETEAEESFKKTNSLRFHVVFETDGLGLWGLCNADCGPLFPRARYQDHTGQMREPAIR